MPDESRGITENSNKSRYPLRENNSNKNDNNKNTKSGKENLKSLSKDYEISQNPDDETFKKPLKRPRRSNSFRDKRSSSVSSLPTIVSNQFDNLNDDVDMDNESIASSQQSTSHSRGTHNRHKTRTTTEPKPHPIVISHVTNTIVQQLLNLPGLKSKGCFMKKGENYQIHASTMDDKKLLIAHLDEKQFVYHSYTEKSERKPVYVLKNHYFIEPDELLNKLKSNDIPAIKVSFMSKSQSNPSYLVQFEKTGPPFATLSNIHNKVDLLKIFWEKLNPKRKRLTQCKRCQSYGHTASNCRRPYRCVKCLDTTHKWGECKRNSHDDQVACILCGLTGHPANSTKCTKYIEQVNKINNQKKHQVPRQFVSTPAPWNQESEGRPTFRLGNNNFPPLPSQYRPSVRPSASKSTSISQRLIVTESDVIHPTHSRYTKENIQKAPREENFFDELSRINDEVGDIPNLSGVLTMYKDLLYKLKQAKNDKERVLVLIAFKSQC